MAFNGQLVWLNSEEDDANNRGDGKRTQERRGQKLERNRDTPKARKGPLFGLPKFLNFEMQFNLIIWRKKLSLELVYLKKT